MATADIGVAAAGWGGVAVSVDAGVCRLECRPEQLPEIAARLMEDEGFAFATLIVEDMAEAGWSLRYVFYKDAEPWVHVEIRSAEADPVVPSLCGLAHGPSVDWHEREASDLFGVAFAGHPLIGDFILHEDWPRGAAPMRHGVDAARPRAARTADPAWKPPRIVAAPGAFAMPVGPIFSDFAEAAHFLLETVGEDVIHTIPRLFYKYRGVEKIAEGLAAPDALLLAERFSGIAAFAHGLGFCQAVETICGVAPPPRALALRTIFAELERLRHHAAVITLICNSTALAVAAAQAALLEEELLRLSGEFVRHRYLFGAVVPGGVACDLAPGLGRRLASAVADIADRLDELHRTLTYSSSFLDRLEEVGFVALPVAEAYGLAGPIARASGLARDIRKLFPYAAYEQIEFAVPIERAGDGYARLRLFFAEAAQSAAIIGGLAAALPSGPVLAEPFAWRAGAALGAVEAPHGAAFHWVRLAADGTVARYRATPPAFANWRGFLLAAEKFAFQDFPIILASFGLSNAECDR
jgi:formate hydrogenlyase subunit 5